MEITTASVSGRGLGKDLAIIKAAAQMAADRFVEPALVSALAVARENGWGVRVWSTNHGRTIHVKATPKVQAGIVAFVGEQ